MSEALFESAQALLTGYDTAISRQWREEDRNWRQEDIAWRKRERDQMNLDKEYMEETRVWRGQDVEQRVLDNARVMWSRFVEKNRRAVEERAEQLKSISNLAALIAGFALIAFLEFSVDIQTTPRGLVLSFGLMTALTVGLMINSMVTCSLMHASILKTGKRYVSEEDEAEFIFRCRQHAKGYRLGDRPPSPPRSFEVHWEQRCESEWRRAFYLFAAGIPAFLTNLALAAWIKFQDAPETAIIITIIMGLSFLVFLITYCLWAPHLLGKEIDLFEGSSPYTASGLPFDWHLIPQRNKFYQSSSAQDRSSPLDGDIRVGVLESVVESGDTSESEDIIADHQDAARNGVESRMEMGDAFPATTSTTSRADEEARRGRRTRSAFHNNARASQIQANQSRSSLDKKPLQRLSSAELILGEFRRSNVSAGSTPSERPASSSFPSQVFNSVVHGLFGSSSAASGRKPGA